MVLLHLQPRARLGKKINVSLVSSVEKQKREHELCSALAVQVLGFIAQFFLSLAAREYVNLGTSQRHECSEFTPGNSDLVSLVWSPNSGNF